MNTILGIKFREYGQIYYFLAGQCSPSIGERVIVETEQGQGIGEVVLIRDTLPNALIPQSGPDDTNLLIQNAVTSVVVVSDSDLSVADIPYASALTKKMKDETGHAEKSTEKSTGEGDNIDSYTDSYPSDADHATTSCMSGTHTCACQGVDGKEHGSCCSQKSSTEHEEELDGYIVASSDMLDNAPSDTTPPHGGRMVSYDGSAGEHSSDSQETEDINQPLSFEDLRPILRMATEYDLEHARSNDFLSREASDYCKECIKARDLDMKLVDVEVFFDLSKFIFYFTAPTRIDFRELVKDLVKHYRTRIELRQIGVRHETQMIGAVGNCGMVCCCRRFLRKFAPVTIKMAKEQNLFLNPAKISGICGRLLCCLSYEQENYEEFHRRCPRLGKKYMTSKGPIKVMRANMFRNSLIAYSETGEELEIPLEEWQELEVRRPDAAQQTTRPARRVSPEGPTNPEGREESKKAVPADKKISSQAAVVPEKNLASEKHGVLAKKISPDKTIAPNTIPDAIPNAIHGAVLGDHIGGKSDIAVSNGDNAHKQDSMSKVTQATPEESTPIKTAHKMAGKVVASLSGTPHVHDGLSEHGIATTKARLEALAESLAGMDGGPLSSITHPDNPVTPAVVAAHVIADVLSVAEVAAKQAPASIVMSERIIKSTDTSALKTSRGRRKRRRKPREGNAEDCGQNSDVFKVDFRKKNIFFDNDTDD